MSEVRESLLYTEGHMWICIDGNKAKVGMTDHAQKDLGDVVFADLPKEGHEYGKGDEFGALESVKTVEPIFAPLSGKVVEINRILEEYPETVNISPYDDGWIAIIELTDASELETLLDASAYSGSV